MNPNILPSKRAVIATRIDPVSQAAGTVTTGWVSMATFDEILATVQAGAFGVSATVDAKLQQATDATGTGVKDIVGKAITQLTAAANANNQALINCRSDELDVANGFAFVRLSITVGTAATLIAALVQGFDARYQPQAAASTVAQTVN